MSYSIALKLKASHHTERIFFHRRPLAERRYQQFLQL